MKTLLAVLAVALMGHVAATVSSRSCREAEAPPAYYRARVLLEDRSVLTFDVDPTKAPAFLSGWRAEGYEAWFEMSPDSGRTWDQATDDGAQTTFTVEERP